MKNQEEIQHRPQDLSGPELCRESHPSPLFVVRAPSNRWKPSAWTLTSARRPRTRSICGGGVHGTRQRRWRHRGLNRLTGGAIASTPGLRARGDLHDPEPGRRATRLPVLELHVAAMAAVPRDGADRRTRVVRSRRHPSAPTPPGAPCGPMSDNELANDRTFLAWLRTSLALIGLGFVSVAKVALIVQPTSATARHQGLYAAGRHRDRPVRRSAHRRRLSATQGCAGSSATRPIQSTTVLATHHHHFGRRLLTFAFRADRGVDVARTPRVKTHHINWQTRRRARRDSEQEDQHDHRTDSGVRHRLSGQ